MNNLKILITGGTGLIGGHVLDRLSKIGHDLIVVSRKKQIRNNNIQFIQMDLLCTMEEMISKKHLLGDVDVIIYMAAYIPTKGLKNLSVLESKESTLDPLVRFIDVFGNAVKKIIYTSSIDVYGVPSCIEYTEHEKIQPITSYALAKYCGELFLKYYCESKGINYSILRYSQVFGPNEQMIRVMPYLINAYKNKIPFNLYGTGNEKRKYLYVKDAAYSVECALNRININNISNIAGKESIGLNELISKLNKATAHELEVNVVDSTPGYDNLPSIDNAYTSIEFEPKYNLDESLQEVMNE